MEKVKALRYCEVSIATLIGGFMGYFLAEGKALMSILAFIIGFLVVSVLDHRVKREILKSETVIVDEMHYVIAEKTGLLAFKLSLMVIAIMIFITVLPTYMELNLIPEGVKLLYPGLGLGMAVLVAYWASYLYYSRSKKPIEGR